MTKSIIINRRFLSLQKTIFQSYKYAGGALPLHPVMEGTLLLHPPIICRNPALSLVLDTNLPLNCLLNLSDTLTLPSVPVTSKSTIEPFWPSDLSKRSLNQIYPNHHENPYWTSPIPHSLKRSLNQITYPFSMEERLPPVVT